MEKIKNILLLSIPFLTVCGVLYNIGYWQTFNIDGLKIIDVSDIIKSSIYPILVFAGLIILVHLLESMKNNSEDINSEEPSDRQKKLTDLIFRRIIPAITPYIIIVMMLIIPKVHTVNWYNWGMFLSILITVNIVQLNIVSKVVNNKNIYNTTLSLFITMIFAFCSGKLDAEEIYYNKSYKFSKIYNINKTNNSEITDTLKYIGVAKEKYFFTDINNSKIYIIAKADTIVLENSKVQL